jgi:hypothetical protein
MGHPLAPSMMQRVSTAVARSVTHQFGITMVAYLDDWLFFSESDIPVQLLLRHLQHLGFTINYQKSMLHPATALVYLGLNTDTVRGFMTPTAQCLHHLQELLSVVPHATRQDLQRIMGYVAWLAFAMGWPAFLATLVPYRNTFWVHRLQQHHFLRQPR